MIPSTVHSTVRSGAERRVFNLLERSLQSENWTCFHSLGLARHETKLRGEIDFVVITPRGLFVLEVKGGRIRREAGTWVFTDRFGQQHRRAEGPFDQAASAMFSLRREIRSKLQFRADQEPLFAYGVVFPDVEFDSLGTEGDPELVYDLRDRNEPFARYLERLARFAEARSHERHSRLSRAQIDSLVEFLRGDFDLVPSMRTVVADAREQLARLTEEQGRLLQSVSEMPRLLVEGAAGSGKTILAAEIARREARQGRRAIFLCYNRLLASRVGGLVERESFAGSVEVRSVHGLFRRLILASSLNGEFEQRLASMPRESAFETLYPEYAALACLESVERPYDTLIVDEAQDVLGPLVFDVLSLLVHGGLESGRWRIFMDVNNQASIYGQVDPALLQRVRGCAPTQLLTANCRNTRAIAVQTNIIACPKFRCEARVDGPPVEFETYSDEFEYLAKLRGVVNRLKLDGLAGEQISVLFPRTPSFAEERLIGELGLERLDAPALDSPTAKSGDSIGWATVSGFKGLENDIIVLAGLDSVDTDWWKAVAYVGMSRARVRLITILHEKCEKLRMDRFRIELERSLCEGEMTT